MAIALIGTDSAGANNANHVTTPGFDTTGANLIVIGVTSDVGGGTPTPTDFYGNTWTALTQATTSGGARVRLFYCANPTVGTGHTVDLNSANTFPSLLVIALSGAKPSSPFDVENGNAFNTATAISPGIVTPSLDGEIVITLLAVDVGATYAIDSSFVTPIQVNFVNGQHYGSALSYIIQTTAGAVTPNWSSWSATDCATVIATFKAAPIIAGALAKTEDADTISAAGTAPAAGALTKTEAADTIVAAGTAPAAGALAKTEAVDTIVAAGTAAIAGSASITDADDTLNSGGNAPLIGQLSVIEAGDRMSIWDFGVTEGNDSIVAEGTRLVYPEPFRPAPYVGQPGVFKADSLVGTPGSFKPASGVSAPGFFKPKA